MKKAKRTKVTVERNITLVTEPPSRDGKRRSFYYLQLTHKGRKGEATFTTLAEAQAARAAWLLGGIPVQKVGESEPRAEDKPPQTLFDALVDKEVEMTQAGQSSARRCGYMVQSFRTHGGLAAALLDRPVETITAAEILAVRAARQAQGFKTSTVWREERILRAVLKKQRADFRAPKLPQEIAGRCPVLDERTEAKIMARLDEPWRLISQVALSTLLRRESVASLRRAQCDLEGRNPRLVGVQTKTGLIHVNLGRKLTAMLQVQLAAHDSEWVFPSTWGKAGHNAPMCGNTAGRKWREACRAVMGTPLRFHDLRHIGISRLLETGMGFPEIMLMAGLKSTKMVMERYGHLKAERIQDAMDKITHGAVPRAAASRRAAGRLRLVSA
jgi:integrase